MVLYAAYGSNLHPVRLRQRLPAARPLASARLDGWRLSFHKRGQDGSGKGALVPADDFAFVAIYSLQQTDLNVLDKIEGVGQGYCRRSVSVPGLGPCQIYLPEDSHLEHGLRPFVWYKRLVLAGCTENGFPPAYINRIRAVAHVDDPHTARRQQHDDLLRQTFEHARQGLAPRHSRPLRRDGSGPPIATATS